MSERDKRAVAGLTKVDAVDLIRHGIRVNAIAPGLTWTPMIAEAAREKGLQSCGSGRDGGYEYWNIPGWMKG